MNTILPYSCLLSAEEQKQVALVCGNTVLWLLISVNMDQKDNRSQKSI